MRGAMLDMYRRPDKLMAAIEKMSQQTLKRIAMGPKVTDFTTAFIALHRGADGRNAPGSSASPQCTPPANARVNPA